MDGERFDAIAKATATASRRQALRLLVAALGGALGLLGQDAGATEFGCKLVDRRCDKDADCCSGACRRRRPGGRLRCRKTTNPDPACAGSDTCCSGPTCDVCAGNSQCWCATTVEGGGICHWDSGCPAPCATSADCGPDAVCVVAATCCGPPAEGGLCVAFATRCRFYHL